MARLFFLSTSDKTFRQVAPWLLLFATLLFAFGNQVSTALRGRLHSSQALMLTLLFPISVYGGYFGGGIGIMILAAFRLYGLTDIHGMNGIKAMLAGSLNGVAAIVFIVAHQVAWRPTLAMMVAGSCRRISGTGDRAANAAQCDSRHRDHGGSFNDRLFLSHCA